MPDANRSLDIVRLESASGTFAILGRFPAGFERPVTGGYAVAEEFIVLNGALEIEGAAVEPGTLCFIPAHHPRAPMRSPDGCTVLAWFSGPPEFRRTEELTPTAAVAVATVAVRAQADGATLLRTSEAEWRIADPELLQDQVPPVDVVDLGLTWWARVGAGMSARLPVGPALFRLPVTDDQA